MRGKTVFAIFFATFPLLINATENTRRGKISFTEGHISPNCRTVELIENSSGNKKRFRIKDVQGSDVSSVVLTAITTHSDVVIWYNSDTTTGCGNEPAINYIRLFSN